jgi:CBS domain containing-hemolysin-like protein
MAELATVLLVTLLLVVLNGVFVAAEFCIISVSRATLGAQARQGESIAAAASRIVDDPRLLDRYIATAQLGITFASLGLGMYGEHNIARFIESGLLASGVPQNGAVLGSHAIATIIALGFVTYLHVVLGEMIPKSLALTHALSTVRWVFRPMALAGLVMRPLVLFLNGAGNAILRLIGFHRGRGASHYYEPDELEELVRESRQSGLIPEEGARVFREIIDFSEITAAEAMVPRVRLDSIPANATAEELRQIVRAHPRTRYPVVDGSLDQIVGTVHVKDLLRLLNEGAGLTPARIRDVAYVPETATLEQVVAAMDRVRNQMVVVMDEHGGTAGVMTIEDVVAEAIGEVEEGIEDLPDVVELGPDRLQVQGTVRLDTLAARFNRDLEYHDVITVSGLILALLGRPPRRSDVVRWQGLEFRVSLLHGRGVAIATVTVREPVEDPRAGSGDGEGERDRDRTD